jgi:DNA-binding transcriptional ArsR family regulator
MELTGYVAPNRLNATFAALADPTRRAILARLAAGEASVNELAAPFHMTQPGISKHLRVLERAGLISTGREAQRRPRRLEAAPLAQATEWLENFRKFWEERFQRLDALLVDLQKNDLPPAARQNTNAGQTKGLRKDDTLWKQPRAAQRKSALPNQDATKQILPVEQKKASRAKKEISNDHSN